MDTTLDGLLNHQIVVEQPKSGFRIALDTVFLAASVPADPHHTVLDMGCGVGGAILCLAFRIPLFKGVGAEIQKNMITLCQKNIERNGFQSRLTVQEANIGSFPKTWDQAFDHVMMNPPYHKEKHHSLTDNVSKRIANVEKTDDLILWIKKASQCLKKTGTLTLIHRADREREICQILSNEFDGIDILYLLPKAGVAPKRLIIRATKEKGGIHHVKPFVLHQIDGTYTHQADNILREAQAINFVRS